jgi:hypothetical protein
MMIDQQTDDDNDPVDKTSARRPLLPSLRAQGFVMSGLWPVLPTGTRKLFQRFIRTFRATIFACACIYACTCPHPSERIILLYLYLCGAFRAQSVSRVPWP